MQSSAARMGSKGGRRMPTAQKIRAKSNSIMKRLRLEGKAEHCIFGLLFLHSAVATTTTPSSYSYFNLSRDSFTAPQLETFQRFYDCSRMNAVTFYRELFAWFLNNVTDKNMFLIQTFGTFCSLVWSVWPSALHAPRAEILTIAKASLACISDPSQTSSRPYSNPRCRSP